MHRVRLTKSAVHHDEAMRWCKNNISLESSGFLFGHWYCNAIATRTSGIMIDYYFKNEGDAVMFKLRWT